MVPLLAKAPRNALLLGRDAAICAVDVPALLAAGHAGLVAGAWARHLCAVRTNPIFAAARAGNWARRAVLRAAFGFDAVSVAAALASKLARLPTRRALGFGLGFRLATCFGAAFFAAALFGAARFALAIPPA